VVIGIGGKVKSIDIFQNTTLFAHYWPAILKSSALAAVTSKEQGELGVAEARKMLAAARSKSAKDGARPEKNRAKISVDEDINASTLDSDKGEVHFSAFPVEKEKNDAIRDVDLDQVNDNILDNNLNLRQK
jgi:hypothetical protein